jgi:hypothetical protein
LHVIRGHEDRRFDDVGQHADRARPVIVGIAAGRDMVVPAVEMPEKADDLVLTREGAGQAQREVGRFGTRGSEADALGARYQLLDQLCPAQLELVRRPEMRAERHLSLHCRDDFRRAVAEQQGAVPTEVVHVLMAVHAPFARSRGPFDEQRIRIEDARIVREPTRERRFCTLVERGRFRGLRAIALEDGQRGGGFHLHCGLPS